MHCKWKPMAVITTKTVTVNIVLEYFIRIVNNVNKSTIPCTFQLLVERGFWFQLYWFFAFNTSARDMTPKSPGFATGCIVRLSISMIFTEHYVYICLNDQILDCERVNNTMNITKEWQSLTLKLNNMEISIKQPSDIGKIIIIHT